MQKLLDDVPTARTFDVEDYIEDADLVENEHQYSGRWTEHWIAVFRRGDEFVALSYEVPATEYQEGSESESSVYPVRPVEVTVTRYEKCR